MRAAALEARIAFNDDRQSVAVHLFTRERQPFPAEIGITFKNAPGVVFNIAAGEILVAEVEHPLVQPQQGRDFVVQKPGGLSVGRGDQSAVLTQERAQDASKGTALGQD